MSNKNKPSTAAEIFSVSSVLVGLIIGAGFASGQELMNFFAKYGYLGAAGIVVSGFIIYLTCRAVFEICLKKKTANYDEFMTSVFGKTVGKLINVPVALFVLVLFCAMLAGAGAAFEQSLGMPFTSGVLIISVLCFCTFLFDLEGIVQINVVLVPIMVVGFLFMGICTLALSSVPAYAEVTEPIKRVFNSFAFSAVIYSSYNLITAVPALCELSGKIKSPFSAKAAAMIAASALTLLSLLFVFPLFAHFEVLSALEIPILELAKRHGSLIEYLYIFVIACAIFTTAVADGFVAIEWLSRRVKAPRILIKLFVCCVGALIAHIGFSPLVGKIYPVFGVIGIVEIAWILLYYFRKK